MAQKIANQSYQKKEACKNPKVFLRSTLFNKILYNCTISHPNFFIFSILLSFQLCLYEA